jgi:hypothetical protein
MYLVDANIVVCSTDPGSEHHDAARDWLDASTVGPPRSVGLPWPSSGIRPRNRVGIRVERLAKAAFRPGRARRTGDEMSPSSTASSAINLRTPAR